MKIAIHLFACIFVTSVYGQEQGVPEDAVSFDILKWHYSYYPNSQNNEWTTVVRTGQQLFRVKFEFKEKRYQAEYDDAGRRLKEVLSLEDNVPVSIDSQLRQFEKFKIDSFTKISDLKENRIVYRLDVKVKSEGNKTFWYDENLIQMPNTDFTRSLSDLY